MDKYRFLFASVDSPPRVGGVSLLAEQLSVSLSEKFGREAVYVGPKGTYFDEQHTAMKLYEDFQSDTSLRAGIHSFREDQRIEELFDKIIKSYGLDCMILWHPFYYGLGGIAAAKKNAIPVSIFVHGTELTSQIPTPAGGEHTYQEDPNSFDLDQRLYRTLREADQILTNSTYTATVIEKTIPDVHVSVVGCGIEEDLFQREINLTPDYNLLSKSIARELMRLPERKTLIQVGRLVPHKNHAKSIELIAASDDLQLIIVGDGRTREELEAKAEALDVSDRVFFKGQVSDADKWKYIRASDAGLLISGYDEATGGYEGFGIAMLEYAAACCGVISTGEFGMYDFVKRYNGGILALNDDRPIEEHASELEAKLNDLGFMKDHIDHSRELIKQRFTWTAVAERLAKAMEE